MQSSHRIEQKFRQQRSLVVKYVTTRFEAQMLEMVIKMGLIGTHMSGNEHQQSHNAVSTRFIAHGRKEQNYS